MLPVQVCPPTAAVRNARFARVSACSKLRCATASAKRRACRRRDCSSHPVHTTKMIPPTSPIKSRSIPRIIRIPSQIFAIAPHLPCGCVSTFTASGALDAGRSAHAGLSSSVTSAFGSVPTTHRSSSKERERCSTNCQRGEPVAIDPSCWGCSLRNNRKPLPTGVPWPTGATRPPRWQRQFAQPPDANSVHAPSPVLFHTRALGRSRGRCSVEACSVSMEWQTALTGPTSSSS
jgi:hypothetical protein